MNVVIVEDEVLLAEELADKLMELSYPINILAILESVEDTVEWLKHNTCDLLFLDIHLSDGISFSIFEQVNTNSPVIFTTAYDNYAIRAFEVNSIAYLLKPIDETELIKAIEKYNNINIAYREKIENLLSYIKNTKEDKSKYKERIILNSGKIQKPVNIDDIAYFEANGRYLYAITKQGFKYFCDFTLSSLEQELNPSLFFRINRTYLVNFDSVKEIIPYSKSRLKINLHPELSDKIILVSAAKVKEFKKWLNK